MEIAPDPFLGRVVDPLVALRRQVVVDSEVVCVDRRVRDPVLGDELLKRAARPVADDLQPDLIFALYGADDHGLVARVVVPNVTALAADLRLDNPDDPAQQRLVVLTDRVPDAAREMPPRAVGDLEGPMKLVGADPLLGLVDQIDGQEPLAQGQVGVVEDRPGRDRELVAA